MNELEQRVAQKQKQILDLLNEIGYGTACNPKTSGEAHALKFALKDQTEGVIFDVGSYHGEFLEVAYAMYPQMQYHCFEPDPIAYKQLLQTADRIGIKPSQFVANNFAISDQTGYETLYFGEQDTGLASLCKRDLDAYGIDFSKTIYVQTKALRECVSDGLGVVKPISYIKLDIEGLEFKVLNSIYRTFASKKIKNIQFEFGGASLDSRTYMKDFYKLLRPQYNIYRIHPEGLILLNDYSELYEVFQPVNYLATLNEE